MSIQTEITRLTTHRNTLRTKLVAMGMVQSNAQLADCVEAVDGLADNGAVSVQIAEGDTYTIPRGYHNGSGTVAGIAGGGNYSLQSKTVTPTKSQQNISSDTGYYGLSSVTVEAIPTNYQDVSPVNATAADVLANKIIVDASGKSVAGTMANNGKVTATLDGLNTMSYTIPKGYHSGTGTVSLTNDIETALAEI